MKCLKIFLVLFSIATCFPIKLIAESKISLPKGTWSGYRTTPDRPDLGGELTIKVGLFSKITFQNINHFYNADKARRKSAKLPSKKSSGVYKLENPFRIDLKGRCGPTTVTVSTDKNYPDNYQFEFVRDRYMLQPLHGEIVFSN